MLGAITVNATSPVMNGELFIWRTSIGKATVDILVPSIDIEDPNIKRRKAGEPETRIRIVRDLFISQPTPRDCNRGKFPRFRSPSAAEGVSARPPAAVSLIRAKIPSSRLDQPWAASAKRSSARPRHCSQAKCTAADQIPEPRTSHSGAFFSATEDIPM